MMGNVFLLIALTYAVSLGAGLLIDRKLRIPWMFAALFFGVFLSWFGLFKPELESETFKALANLGMLTLLFLIGFNLRLEKLKKLGKYIAGGTVFILGTEAFFGTLLFYFLFPSEVSNSLLIALITALSFATVGEAVLLPILSEFGALNTTFGQLTLGIGTLDDIMEVLMLVAVSMVAFSGAQAAGMPAVGSVLATAGVMAVFALALFAARGSIKSWLANNPKLHYVHDLLILAVLFSFIALSQFAMEALTPVAAILAGVVSRGLFPKRMLYENEKSVNFLAYVFLSPLFFLSVGAEVSIPSLLVSPALIAAIWVVAKGSKLLSSMIFFRKLLGVKYSLLLGLGLSVRFSTSLVVQSILLGAGLISVRLFSALIATAILMKPVIIVIYSWVLKSRKPP